MKWSCLFWFLFPVLHFHFLVLRLLLCVMLNSHCIVIFCLMKYPHAIDNYWNCNSCFGQSSSFRLCSSSVKPGSYFLQMRMRYECWRHKFATNNSQQFNSGQLTCEYRWERRVVTSEPNENRAKDVASPPHVDAIHLYFLQFWSMLFLRKPWCHLSIFFSVYLFSFSPLVANPLFFKSIYCHCFNQCVQPISTFFYYPHDVSYSSFLSYFCAFNPVSFWDMYSYCLLQTKIHNKPIFRIGF